MSQAPDPADKQLDAKADGQFTAAGAVHRAGYTADQLAWVKHWAAKGACLGAGEGLVLLKELERVEAELAELRKATGLFT